MGALLGYSVLTYFEHIYSRVQSFAIRLGLILASKSLRSWIPCLSPVTRSLCVEGSGAVQTTFTLPNPAMHVSSGLLKDLTIDITIAFTPL